MHFQLLLERMTKLPVLNKRSQNTKLIIEASGSTVQSFCSIHLYHATSRVFLCIISGDKTNQDERVSLFFADAFDVAICWKLFALWMTTSFFAFPSL